MIFAVDCLKVLNHLELFRLLLVLESIESIQDALLLIGTVMPSTLHHINSVFIESNIPPSINQ